MARKTILLRRNYFYIIKCDAFTFVVYRYQKPDVRTINGTSMVVSNGQLDLGTLHSPAPAKIQTMRIGAHGLVPKITKVDSIRTGNKAQHTKMCINEEGFLIMFRDLRGTRTIECKPTITTSLWEQNMKDLVVRELCAVHGRKEYLVCTIETPKSIQIRSMKTGDLLCILRIAFSPGKICSHKPGSFLVVEKTRDKKLKLAEFRITEKIIGDRLKIKLEEVERTLENGMEIHINGLVPVKDNGRLLLSMVTRMNDVVQAIDYVTGDVVWTNDNLCDGLQTESIDLCQDNVGFMYITDKLYKRIVWVSADGKQKKKLIGVPSVSDICSAAWDKSQQRLFLLTVDHRGEEWLKGFRASYVKPGTRLKDLIAERKPKAGAKSE